MTSLSSRWEAGSRSKVERGNHEDLALMDTVIMFEISDWLWNYLCRTHCVLLGLPALLLGSRRRCSLVARGGECPVRSRCAKALIPVQETLVILRTYQRLKIRSDGCQD